MQFRRFLRILHAWLKNQKRIERFQDTYDALIDYTVRFYTHNEENISMGEGVVISAGTFLHAKNVPGKKSTIAIGKNTYMAEYVSLIATGGNIVIGDHCLIAAHSRIVAANHDYKRKLEEWDDYKKDVTIGNHVWLGTGACVLPGVTIGDWVVIGAGAVVTKDVSSYSVVAGVPARLIGSLMEEK